MPPDTPKEFDPLGVGLAAIVMGASAGGTLVSLVLFAAHGMNRGAQPFAGVILAGAAGGLAVAALVAFLVGRRLGATRAALAAIPAVAGSALVTVLTIPADVFLGRPGLLLLAGLCVAVGIASRRLFLGRGAA